MNFAWNKYAAMPLIATQAAKRSETSTEDYHPGFASMADVDKGQNEADLVHIREGMSPVSVEAPGGDADAASEGQDDENVGCGGEREGIARLAKRLAGAGSAIGSAAPTVFTADLPGVEHNASLTKIKVATSASRPVEKTYGNSGSLRVVSACKDEVTAKALGRTEGAGRLGVDVEAGPNDSPPAEPSESPNQSQSGVRPGAQRIFPGLERDHRDDQVGQDNVQYENHGAATVPATSRGRTMTTIPQHEPEGDRRTNDILVEATLVTDVVLVHATLVPRTREAGRTALVVVLSCAMVALLVGVPLGLKVRSLRNGKHSIVEISAPPLGKLRKLEKLHLHSNRLPEEIPTELGILTWYNINLIELDSLRLSSNLLSGKIPTELGKLTWLNISREEWNGSATPSDTSQLSRRNSSASGLRRRRCNDTAEGHVCGMLCASAEERVVDGEGNIVGMAGAAPAAYGNRTKHASRLTSTKEFPGGGPLLGPDILQVCASEAATHVPDREEREQIPEWQRRFSITRPSCGDSFSLASVQ
jgi:hypothetical protein